jgi:hypothetical protein
MTLLNLWAKKEISKYLWNKKSSNVAVGKYGRFSDPHIGTIVNSYTRQGADVTIDC